MCNEWYQYPVLQKLDFTLKIIRKSKLKKNKQLRQHVGTNQDLTNVRKIKFSIDKFMVLKTFHRLIFMQVCMLKCPKSRNASAKLKKVIV